MGKITGFLKDVVSEMRKVSWPKRKELTRYTIVVIFTVVFMAVYFGTCRFRHFRSNEMVYCVIIGQHEYPC